MKNHAAGKSFRVMTAILVLAVCFSCTVCGAQAEEAKPGGFVGMPNPVVEYDSLEEINGKIGVNLLKPSVSGVSEERFSVISDTIAQYVCDISGNEWTFRAAYVTDEDISGMFSEYNEFIPNQDSGVYTNEFYLERFFDGDRQYTIVVTDPVTADGEIRIGENEFSDICLELQLIQKAHMDDPLVGDYQETDGGSAFACVERFGDTYNVSVNRSDAANAFRCWTMFDAVREGGRLTYRGEEIGQYTYDAEGNETSAEVTAANNLDFLEIRDGMLYWTGAAQEECRSWIFEKIIYEE